MSKKKNVKHGTIRKCPACGAAVSSYTTGDGELFSLIDAMERSLVKMKTANQTNFNTEKAEAESLLRKAKLFYGDNKKVQMLVFDLENKINELTKLHRRKALAGNTVLLYHTSYPCGLYNFNNMVWIWIYFPWPDVSLLLFS